MKPKSQQYLCTLVLMIFSNLSFADVTWLKNADKATRVTKKDLVYESGRITDNGTPIANYVLQERISANLKKGEKKTDYLMTVIFSNGNTQSYAILQGNHDFAAKQYNGQVVGASQDQTELMGYRVLGDDNSGQWLLSSSDNAQNTVTPTEDNIVLNIISERVNVPVHALEIINRGKMSDADIRWFKVAVKGGDCCRVEDVYLFPNNQEIPNEFMAIVREWLEMKQSSEQRDEGNVSTMPIFDVKVKSSSEQEEGDVSTMPLFDVKLLSPPEPNEK